MLVGVQSHFLVSLNSSHFPLNASTGHLPVPGSVVPPSSILLHWPLLLSPSCVPPIVGDSSIYCSPEYCCWFATWKGTTRGNFTGEDSAVRWEDWLHTLERAATWNGWSDEESLMQLAGHLRGRVLVEWNLLSGEEKITYSASKQALHDRLDPGSKVLAAQDFRHAIQKDDESVADFVRRMERCFQVAYGRDRETRETILFGQLQEGLKYGIVKSLSVSGCQSYKVLCMAAKNEEKRIAGLQRRQQYQRGGGGNRENSGKPQSTMKSSSDKQQSNQPYNRLQRKCYNCGSMEHTHWKCKESAVQPGERSGTKMVTSATSKGSSVRPYPVPALRLWQC